MQIILIRHGETEEGFKNIILGSLHGNFMIGYLAYYSDIFFDLGGIWGLDPKLLLTKFSVNAVSSFQDDPTDQQAVEYGYNYARIESK